MTTLVPPRRRHRTNLLGDLADFRTDSLAMLLDIAQNYGPITQLRFGPVPLYVLTDPAAMHHVLQTNQRNYSKEQSFMNHARRALQTKDNLFTSDGAAWLKQRRLMQPAFHRQQIAHFADLITAETVKALDKWQPNQPLNIEAVMMDITMSIIGRAMLNVDILSDHPQLYQAFTTISTYVADRAANLLAPLTYGLNGRNRDFHAAVSVAHGMLEKAIQQRIQSNEHPGDLLDMLLSARDPEDNSAMSTAKLVDELFGIVSAGHETSAVSLAWLFQSLAEYPAVEATLYAELDRVLGDRLPRLADLPQLPYLKQTIDETLRRYPAAFVSTRDALGADEICGYRIPAKAMLLLNIYGLHHHAQFWTDPMRFAPSRFAPENARQLNKLAYLPFLLGPRRCIGEPLALLEMQLITATIVQRYRLQQDVARPARLISKFTLRAEGGLWMIPTVRQNAGRVSVTAQESLAESSMPAD